MQCEIYQWVVEWFMYLKEITGQSYLKSEVTNVEQTGGHSGGRRGEDKFRK